MVELFFKQDIAHQLLMSYIPAKRIVYDILYISPSNGYVFEDICKAGDTRCILLSLDRGEYDLEYGLYGACEGGHIQIIDMLLEKTGAYPSKSEWNTALLTACRGGHRKAVDFVVDHGANDWNSGFLGACMANNTEMINLMIQRGACKWNDGLYWGCRNGNNELVDDMIRRGAKICYNCENRNHPDIRR